MRWRHKHIRIHWRVEDMAFATEILSYGGLKVAAVCIDFIDLFEFFPVHVLENRSDKDIDRTEEKWNFSVVEFSLVEKITGDGVCIVDLSRVLAGIPDGRKGIVAEDNRIVCLEEFRMKEDSVFQVYLAESFLVLLFSEGDAFTGKTKGDGIDPILAKKECS